MPFRLITIRRHPMDIWSRCAQSHEQDLVSTIAKILSSALQEFPNANLATRIANNEARYTRTQKNRERFDSASSSRVQSGTQGASRACASEHRRPSPWPLQSASSVRCCACGSIANLMMMMLELGVRRADRTNYCGEALRYHRFLTFFGLFCLFSPFRKKRRLFGCAATRTLV